MLKQEKEAFLSWLNRNCFAVLVASTVALMAALTLWSNSGRYVNTETSSGYAPISTFDDNPNGDNTKDAFWIIHESGFGFLKSHVSGSVAFYEVYVVKPLYTLRAVEDLCNALKEIQSDEVENVTVSVINYVNRELVDYIVENGHVTWSRR